MSGGANIILGLFLGKKVGGFNLLSNDFSHNISVGLFHDKKCCICINLFPCIFVGFICNRFSIEWWRFVQDS